MESRREGDFYFFDNDAVLDTPDACITTPDFMLELGIVSQPTLKVGKKYITMEDFKKGAGFTYYLLENRFMLVKTPSPDGAWEIRF
jgi:hypothetical protein